VRSRPRQAAFRRADAPKRGASRPCSRPRIGAETRGARRRRPRFFPMTAGGFPRCGELPAGCRTGAIAGCGGRFSDGGVEASPLRNLPPHEVAGCAQRLVGAVATAPRGVSPAAASATARRRARGAQATCVRAFAKGPARARAVDMRRPWGTFPWPESGLNSGSCGRQAPPDEAERNVNVSIWNDCSPGGLRLGPATFRIDERALGRPPYPRCTPCGGGIPLEPEGLSLAPKWGAGPMPVGDISRGTRLATTTVAAVPPWNGKRRAGEERVQ